jgi:hypothetical protein
MSELHLSHLLKLHLTLIVLDHTRTCKLLLQLLLSVAEMMMVVPTEQTQKLYTVFRSHAGVLLLRNDMVNACLGRGGGRMLLIRID